MKRVLSRFAGRHLAIATIGLFIHAWVFAKTGTAIENPVADIHSGVEIRAELIARDRVTLASGINGKLAVVSAREGEAVQKNTLLIEFNCDLYLAAFHIAQAKVDGAQARFQSNKDLLAFNSVGPLEVKISEAELAMASGELAYAQAERSHCHISAPYELVVVLRHVDPQQFVRKGDPLLEVYSPHNMEVHWVAPSNWLSWLSSDETAFSFYVDEIKKSFSGVVTRFGGVVDPVSQTVEVFGRLDRTSIGDQLPGSVLLPGMSGTVKITGQAL